MKDKPTLNSSESARLTDRIEVEITSSPLGQKQGNYPSRPEFQTPREVIKRLEQLLKSVQSLESLGLLDIRSARANLTALKHLSSLERSLKASLKKNNSLKRRTARMH